MRVLDEVAPTGERYSRVGASDICRLLRISSAGLVPLVDKGLVVRVSRDAYDLEQSVGNVIEHYRAQAARWSDGDDGANLTAERARLAKAQADAQEMKNAVQRGELVPAAEVVREWSDILRGVRSQVLALPARLRQSLGLDAATAEGIDRELRATLARLGEGDAAD